MTRQEQRNRSRGLQSVLALLLVFLLPAIAAAQGSRKAADVESIREQDAKGRGYTLVAPRDAATSKTKRTLVVWVHGAGGNGTQLPGAISAWAAKGDCIVVSPDFSLEPPYQYLDGGSEEQLVELFASLKDRFPLHDRLFIAGFSGGGQYAHRFALAHPELVVGCAAHSGGTWATGETYVGSDNLIDQLHPQLHQLADHAAANIPWLVTCGENDTEKSFGPAPLGRLEWAKKFAAEAEKNGFCIHAAWIPNTGHSMGTEAINLTRACYEFATVGRATLDQHLAAIEAKLQPPVQGKAKAPDIAGAISLIRKPPKLDERVGGVWAKSMKQQHAEALDAILEKLQTEALAALDAAESITDEAARKKEYGRIRAAYAKLKTKELEARLQSLPR